MIVKVETFLVLNRSFFVHSLNYQFQFFIVIGTYGNCKAFVYKEIIIQKLFEYSFATTFSSKSDSSLSPICPKPCRVIGAKLIRAWRKRRRFKKRRERLRVNESWNSKVAYVRIVT